MLNKQDNDIRKCAFLQEFFSHILLPGKTLHISEAKSYGAYSVFRQEELHELLKFLNKHKTKNLYYLANLPPDSPATRVGKSDDVITQRNHVVVDFDIRSNSEEELTNEYIKEYAKHFREVLSRYPYLRDWYAIVFSGNGLHIYYVGDPVDTEDSAIWKVACQVMFEKIEKILGEKTDKTVKNPGRIMRCPFTYNQKNGAEVIPIYIQKDRKSKIFSDFPLFAKHYFDEIRKELEQKPIVMSSKQNRFGSGNDIERINDQIKIQDIVSKLMGWQAKQDRRGGWKFYDVGSYKEKACWVPANENFILHGGTEHLPDTYAGYNVFNFVKVVKGLTNKETFQYLKLLL